MFNKRHSEETQQNSIAGLKQSVITMPNSSLWGSNGVSLSYMRNRRKVMKRQKRGMRDACWAEFIRPCQQGC